MDNEEIKRLIISHLRLPKDSETKIHMRRKNQNINTKQTFVKNNAFSYHI